MTFAVFYNRSDLTPIVAEFTRSSLNATDKAFALSCWQSGLSGWDTAPLAPDIYRCVDTPAGRICDDDCRIVVINGKHKGVTITLAQFIDFLRRMSVLPGGEYLGGLADDMASGAGAKDPWV